MKSKEMIMMFISWDEGEVSRVQLGEKTMRLESVSLVFWIRLLPVNVLRLGNSSFYAGVT
jgi:hypothetical protein